jgi:class 3 adenylate cyclase/tetratricopeptide (TPR) repeat protein
MFCDMVGSSALATRLDPEDHREVVAAFHACCAKEIKVFGGMVAQYLGDGVLAYFGYPSAHENDAERAILAGLAILKAVTAPKAGGEMELQTRIAVGSGVVVVGNLGQQGVTQENAATGETTNLVARLQAIAEPNSLVVSPATHRLVGALFDYRDLGRHTLKGFSEPVHVRQVLGPSKVESRFEARRAGALSPLVGRQEELDMLLRRWEQAKFGAGRVVLVSGEPGVGKSRIAESLLAGLEGEPHTRLRYFCSPHHTHSPLYPSIAQLERAAGFEPGSSAGAKLDKLEALLRPTAKNISRDVALIAELLGVPTDERYPVVEVSPQQRREMILTALLDQLDGVAARSPVVILFEDIHWIDPTSLDLLDRTIARVAKLPVLLVVTFRPEMQPTWVDQPHVTMWTLSRLGRRDSADIIGAVAKGKALPEAVVEQVLAHTDGVPLFIEELTSTLLESGLLRETTDRYVLDGPLPPLAVPTTLQASLVARLDRLAPVKDVAQIGAAIGREFSHELIAAVASLPAADLDEALERLTASGLISRRGMPPDATYLFKHALVQDAAYTTLLKSRRRQLHASIAKVLVERFPAMAESLPEVVAHHFTEAGLASEASGYWRRAGQLAAGRSANREAVNFFERALQAVKALPDSRERAIDLHLEAGRCLLILGELGRKRDHARRAEALAESLGDERLLARTILALAAGAWTSGDLDHALELGERGRAIARRLNDVALQTLGTYVLGLTGQTAGNYRQSADALRQVSETLRGDRRHEVLLPGAGLGSINAQTRLVWCLAELGEFAEAMARSEEALQIAGEVEHSSSLVLAYRSLGIVFLRLGVLPQAIQAFERAVELCRAAEVRVLFDITAVHLGYAYALSGRVSEGTTLIEEALAEPQATGITHRPLLLAYLGEARLLAGRRDDATAVAGRALDLARAQKERGNEGWVLRLLGDIAAQADPTDPKPASQYYTEALVRANELGMRPLAAHCHAGLAKLTRRVGKPQDANEHFATATAMYRDMGMTSWLERLEGELRPE